MTGHKVYIMGCWGYCKEVPRPEEGSARVRSGFGGQPTGLCVRMEGGDEE